MGWNDAAAELSAEEVRIKHLELALQGMLDSYYRLTDQLPKKTIAYEMCVGAFGETPDLVARLLDKTPQKHTLP